MLERFPFWHRAIFLAGLMVIVAAWDIWRNGSNPTRPKEYAFIWLTGLLGCLIGGATDSITSTISPDYFVLGKGLLGGAGFGRRAAMFGIKEGLSAGVIAGAICVYASQRKSRHPPLDFGILLRMLWIPIVFAWVAALLLPFIAGNSDPAGLIAQTDGQLSQAQARRFIAVWWIHTGLYGGLLAGLIWMICAISKRRIAGGDVTSNQPRRINESDS